MLQLKEPFRIVLLAIFSSTIAVFLYAYRWLAGTFSIKDLAFIAAMFAVLLFMAFMIRNLRTVKRPDNYMLEVYNTLGEEDGVNFRKEFKNYDVAVSYMQMYRKAYPHYRFVLVSNSENSKKTVHKWLE
jgi:hypothetical protein